MHVLLVSPPSLAAAGAPEDARRTQLEARAADESAEPDQSDDAGLHQSAASGLPPRGRGQRAAGEATSPEAQSQPQQQRQRQLHVVVLDARLADAHQAPAEHVAHASLAGDAQSKQLVERVE